MYEIEVFIKDEFKDSCGEHVLSDISGIGIKGVTEVNYAHLYLIDCDIAQSEVEMIASELLSDRITECYRVNSKSAFRKYKFPIIEVLYKKGVTDTVAESIVKAIRDLGITKHVKINTGHKYCIHGNVSRTVLDKIASKLLANTLVQEYKIK